MLLEKSDLKQIEKIVGGVEDRLNKKIDGVENRIIAVINREVGDLAEINRAVIEKVDTIKILEKRMTRIEHKVGIIN